MRDYNDNFHLKDGSYTGVTLMSHTRMCVGVHPAGNGSNKEKEARRPSAATRQVNCDLVQDL